MPEENFQDKTEPATAKKKQEARKKGQVAKSKELGSIAILSAGVIYLFFCGKDITLELGNNIQQTFLIIPQFKSSDYNLMILLTQAAKTYLRMILPIMLTLSIIAILSNVLQTGFIWSVETLTPKMSKINPIAGVKKMFSMRSLVELAKSIAKILIVGWAAFSVLKDNISHLIPLVYQGKVQIISMLADTSLQVVTRCCYVIALLAILDFLYQKWDFEKNLKMTKQEVKDEFKQTEGDPMIKSRIRSIQREMARKRMMQEVPKADVVITNPTHLAIALRYDLENMTSPMIVAKGANKVAFRIKTLATENNIPVVENRTLAQNLYKLDIGKEIPPHFYQAVAEILAYVYGLKKKESSKA